MWYSERIPGLAFLKHPTNNMIEYGHRHAFPPVGEFKSRFTLDVLSRTDSDRGREAAAILDRYPAGRYGRFLRDYPAARDSFLHEARVHISNRNRHLADRVRHPEGSRDRGRHATVALREHQILELFFPKTLAASSFRFSAEKVEGLQRDLLPDYYFRSKAGAHLITAISEGVLRMLLLLPAIVLLIVDRILSPDSRKKSFV